MRTLPSTVQATSVVAGSRREGGGCRVLHFVEELQHAGWRGGLHGRQPGAGVGVGAAEELLRLRDVYADPGCVNPGLEGPQECVHEICDIYRKRRDVLVEGLNKLGWPVALPKATMFVWAQIPEQYRKLGSLEFSKLLLTGPRLQCRRGLGLGLRRRACAVLSD